MADEHLKISNPDRIMRILQRVCQAGLPLVIRVPQKSGLSIRAKASHLSLDTEPPGMKLGHVSVKGLEHLSECKHVQVEFVLMSTKVVFVAMVLARDINSITVSIPASIISIERRANSRYQTTDQMAAYVKLSIWHPNAGDLAGAPWYGSLSQIGGRLRVVDMSEGGFCLVSRFPEVNDIMIRGAIDGQAQLLLPMRPPIDVRLEVRWTKRIREEFANGQGNIRKQRTNKYGCEFIFLDDQKKVQVLQFLQQLIQAEAV